MRAFNWDLVAGSFLELDVDDISENTITLAFADVVAEVNSSSLSS